MRLYNTLSRTVEELVPVESGRVKMYACGPTVYRSVHLGNLRTFMLADLIRRAAEFEGYGVRLVQNITDVGHMTDESSPEAVDKMQLAMEDEGLQPLEIAEKYTKAALEDMAAVGIRLPDLMPKATDHILEMMGLTERLVEKGHAYVVDTGSVYYDVASFPGYGKLSGNTVDKLKAGHRDLETDPAKRNPADFALWKSAGPGRLMKWPSPWGEGFPGWHVECSAMSMKYLGDRFDIHTGGNDLKFPHHEDEIAQSEGATDHQVVSIWVHGGFLLMGEKKMAKSARNIQRVTDLAEHGIDPLAYRLLCFNTRYRSEMGFTWDSLEGQNARLTHLRQRMQDWAHEPLPETGTLSSDWKDFDRRFRDAVANDLDLPEALVALNAAVTSARLAGGQKYALIASWDQILGLDLERLATAKWKPTEEILDLVRRRDEARVAKDFATSDEIRRELISMGLEVMDTAQGTKVRPKA